MLLGSLLLERDPSLVGLRRNRVVRILQRQVWLLESTPGAGIMVVVQSSGHWLLESHHVVSVLCIAGAGLHRVLVAFALRTSRGVSTQYCVRPRAP